MTVQRRMFLGLLSVVFVFVITINAIVQTLLRDIAEREILIELENAVVAYRRFDEQRKELLITRALSVAQTAHLVATLGIPDVDAETVRVAGQYLDGASNAELLLILSATGELMADVNGSGMVAKVMDLGPGVQQAMNGESSVQLWRSGTDLYQLAIVPVISNFQVLGVLAAGQRIDDDDAIKLAEDISGANVTWSDDDLLVSKKTTRDSDRGDVGRTDATQGIFNIGEEIRRVDGATLTKLSIDGNLHFKATVSYPNLRSRLIFHQEFDLAASGVATVRRVVLICSIIIVLLGMGLCYRIALRISRPVIRLTEVTSDFGNGDFNARLPPTSDDEIGALTSAFNEMADEIVEQRRELMTSLDAAEAANRAKSEFLARMSHEIRTPMNGVLGMAELLLTSDIGEQPREYALTILDSGDGLMAIINDVLDFSKIEAGKLELNIAQFDAYEAVSETTALLSHHAENKGLNLVSQLRPEKELWVWGDKLRFKQILMNLIGNAVKFTEDGHITIGTNVVDDGNDATTLRVEIADTGVGIHTDDLAQIFDLFTQVDGSDSRRFGGTGLGLPISKELVEMMGGRIGADSTIGKGSTFWFEMTLRRSTDRENLRNANGTEESALLSEADLPLSLSVRNIKPLQRSAKVLLAEDNKANQKVATTMLKMLGCEIDFAEDGQVAVAKAKEHSYDIILMDCQMPNMDGFSATAAIRALEKERNIATPIPIIAVTANALVSDRERCLAAGMSDYISKPFRLASLKEGIERWLPTDQLAVTHERISDCPTIGTSVLDELSEFGASAKELEEIVVCYIEGSSTSITSMNAAIKARDRESLRSLAHKLKGGSGQVGAQRVADICRVLQTDARSASWPTLAKTLSGLTSEICAANEELSAVYRRESA